MHLDDDPCTTVHLPHRPESVGEARRMMAAELTGAGVADDVVDDARIVLSELVSNAYEHGRPDPSGNIEIAWCLDDGRLRISVFDGGRAPSLDAQPFADAKLRGRGLAIVDFLCDNWEHDSDDGTRVTAELRLDAA